MFAREPPAAKPVSTFDSLRSFSGPGILLGSRVVMIGCGFATYAVVARKLTTAEFGLYGVIGALLNVLNTVLGTGTNQGLSRLVSRHHEAARSLLRHSLRWAGLLLSLAAVALLLGAPLGGALLRDPALTPLLRAAALIPGLYAINSTYSGFLNGMRAFGRQGFVNMSVSLSRMLLVAGAAWLGYGLQGTVYGMLGAAAVGAFAAHLLARMPAGAAEIALGPAKLARLLLSFVGVSLLLQLLLANDLLLLKRLLPAADANHEAGLYTAAQSIARIPYFFLIGISQVIYPRLSARVAHGDVKAARLTSSLVLTGLLVALAGGLALCLPLTAHVIRIIYPERYTEGAAALGWLLCASAALSLAEASLSMLSGVAGPRRSIYILTSAVLVQGVLAVLWIPQQGGGGAARATLCAALLAALAAVLLLRQQIRTTLWLPLLGWAALAVVALAVASSLWARLQLALSWTVAFLGAAYAGYLFVLYRLNGGAARRWLAEAGA